MFTSIMATETEEILRRVAAGELTPEEALPLLDAARPSTAEGMPRSTSDDSQAAASTPTSGPSSGAGAPPWGTPPGPEGGRLGQRAGEPVSTADKPRAIRIAASYRSIEVVADPSIDGAFVTGEHTVRREGDSLVVEASALPFLGDEDEPGGRFSFSNLPKTIARARNWQNEHLTVRFNPELPVELDVAGASVRMVGGESGARIRLLASAFKADRVRGPLDVDAVSSSVKGTLGPTGTSRISAESSSVKVQLLAGTGVRLHARNRMGKVVLPQSVTKGDMVDPGIRESVVGDGRGELVVESVMSSVVIGADVIGSASSGVA
jgi:hypothetical protein